MITLKNTILIEVLLPEVFAFVSDPRNNPKWNYYIVQVEKLNSLEGEGAAYLQTRKTDRQKLKVMDYQENERLVVQTLPGERPAARRTMVFEAEGNRTRILDQLDLLVPIPGFLSGWLGKRPGNAVRQNLEKLKELLESGSVVLQDGRSVQR